MSLVAARLDGPHVALPSRHRPEPLTPAQQLRRRNALWLFAVDVGLYDAGCDRVRPHSTEEIAALFSVPARTVRHGVASARKLREIADAAS